MTSTSFTMKLLQVNFTLDSGTFDGTNNTKQILGLRAECEIDKSGQPAKNKMKLKVYGMNQADMKALTTIPSEANKPLAVHHNKVQVLAGDLNGMAVAFEGEITEAYSNYHQPPNLYFSVEAIAGFYPSLAPAKPTSYKGAVAVSTLMSNLANQMGYQFENAGVTAQLSNPYLPGTAFSQAASVATAANIEWGVDDGKLYISPLGQPRAGTAPLISKDTGLDEYPTFDKKGLKFSCLYNPGLKLGGLCVVQSAIDVACGTWKINTLKHSLSTLSPGGKWLSKVEASYIGGDVT